MGADEKRARQAEYAAQLNQGQAQRRAERARQDGGDVGGMQFGPADGGDKVTRLYRPHSTPNTAALQLPALYPVPTPTLTLSITVHNTNNQGGATSELRSPASSRPTPEHEFGRTTHRPWTRYVRAARLRR